MRPSRLAAGIAFLLLAPMPAFAANPHTAANPHAETGLSVPLRVQEEIGVKRRGWPVTLGVPLPRSALGATGSVRVVDAKSGKQLPTQSRVLGQWPGSTSVRWLLVDFQTDLEPRQKQDLQLHSGKPAASKLKVDVRQRGDEIDVDTGGIRFVAGRASGGIFRLQAIEGATVRSDPIQARMTANGNRSTASPPDNVVVEENGPLRATLRLRGRYNNGFAYEIRLQAFAGQPYVRMQHTFINEGSRAYASLERLSVQVPSLGKGEPEFEASLTVGPKLTGQVGANGTVLAQIDAATLSRNNEAKAGRFAGWFAMRAADFSVGLDVPFFWQEFPQTVTLSPGELTYDLWDGSRGPAKVGIGAAKTHEFYLVFATGNELVEEPARGVTSFADPSWTAKSGALPNALDPARQPGFVHESGEGFARAMQSIGDDIWDEAGACPPATPHAGNKSKPPNDDDEGENKPVVKAETPPPVSKGSADIPRVGDYGMLNWGDWNYRGYHDLTKGCDAWGNEEYDLSQALGLLFAATGRSEVREFLVAAARHYTDVDIIHYLPQRPEWVGMNHPKNPNHFSFDYGGVDLGHTWVEGLFTYHFLTGEQRARDAAIGISDFLVRRARTALKGNPRQFGWPAIALAVAYEATGEQKYRDAALQYARAGTRAHPVPEHIDRDWKLGILADGVSYVQAINPDPALSAWLKLYAATALKSQAADSRFYPAVAYVGRVNKDEKLLQAARIAANRIRFGSWAKPFTIATRTGFRILSQVDAAP